MTVSSVAAAPPGAAQGLRAPDRRVDVARGPDRARKALAGPARCGAALRAFSRLGFSTAASGACERDLDASLSGCRRSRNRRCLTPRRGGPNRRDLAIPAGPAGGSMALEGLLDTEHHRAARRLIEQAGTILAGLHGDM